MRTVLLLVLVSACQSPTPELGVVQFDSRNEVQLVTDSKGSPLAGSVIPSGKWATVRVPRNGTPIVFDYTSPSPSLKFTPELARGRQYSVCCRYLSKADAGADFSSDFSVSVVVTTRDAESIWKGPDGASQCEIREVPRVLYLAAATSGVVDLPRGRYRVSCSQEAPRGRVGAFGSVLPTAVPTDPVLEEVEVGGASAWVALIGATANECRFIPKED